MEEDMASANIVYFDLETQKSAAEVGGWDHIRDMKMSVGVTYSTTRKTYEIYGEDRVNELIDELMRADLVVGFNHIRFDYEVLYGYTVLDLSQAPSLDLMLDLQKKYSITAFHWMLWPAPVWEVKKPQRAFRRLNGSSREKCSK